MPLERAWIEHRQIGVDGGPFPAKRLDERQRIMKGFGAAFTAANNYGQGKATVADAKAKLAPARASMERLGDLFPRGTSYRNPVLAEAAFNQAIRLFEGLRQENPHAPEYRLELARWFYLLDRPADPAPSPPPSSPS